jgi:tetratricopeptide (TPR) repeat protein
MPSSPASSDPHRLTKLIAAAVVAVTIVCLLALVIIVAREQIAGPAIAVEDARDTNDSGTQRRALEALLARDPHDDSAVAELAVLATAEQRWTDAAVQWGKLAKLDPLHPDARFEQARSLLAMGDVDAAAAAVTADGREPGGRESVLLARAALLRGDLRAARDHADAAVRAAPGLPAARLLTADLAFLGRDDARAASLYEQLLDEPDAAAAARLGLAQIAMRAGDTGTALSALRQLPADAGYQLGSARAALYRQLGQMEEAQADYVTLIGRYGPLPDLMVPLAELRAVAEDAAAVRDLRASLVGTAAVDLAARHYLQAIEHYLDGDAAAARDYLGWSAEFFGGRDLYRWMQLDAGAELGDAALVRAAVRSMTKGVVSPARRARAAAVLTSRAAGLADAGTVDDARLFAEAALELVPDLPDARLVAARAALLDGDTADASALAAQLVDAGKQRAGALEVLGRAALRDGDLAGAVAHFDALAVAAPGSASAAFWRGVAAERAGELVAATDHLRRAYELRPDPRIEATLMDVLLEREDWAAAEALANQVAAAAAPAIRARGLAYLGGALRAQGRLAEAAAAYVDAAATDPARSPYALAAGDLLMALERWDEAAALLAKAAATHPDNRYIAFKRALLAQRAGRKDEAERRYRAVLATTPDWALPMVNLSELLADEGADGPRAESLTLAERAARVAPKWPDAHWNLAQRRAASGDEPGALAAAREVLSLAPGHAGARGMVQRLGKAT